MNENLQELAVQAANGSAEAEKQHSDMMKDVDDEILEDELQKLTKSELIEKLNAARKGRNTATAKCRSKARTNVKNVKNLTEKLLAGEKRERILKDKCEYMYDLLVTNNIEVDFSKIKSHVEEKNKKRDLLHDNLF